jgi:hypothetical protein
MCGKETTMVVEGTLKKGALTSTENLIPYLDSTGPENQKRLAGPEN